MAGETERSEYASTLTEHKIHQKEVKDYFDNLRSKQRVGEIDSALNQREIKEWFREDIQNDVGKDG